MIRWLGFALLLTAGCDSATNGGNCGATCDLATTAQADLACGAGGCAPADLAGCGACDLAPPPHDFASTADLACTTSATCGASSANLCSDSTNCGACGHDCQGGACVGGQCQSVTVADQRVTPWEVAVDATNIYWTEHFDNMTDGVVQTRPKAGTTITPLASTQWGPRHLTTRGGNLYWENFYAGEIWKLEPALTGTAALVISAPGQMATFDVDAVNAYYVLNGGPVIKSAPLSGTMTTSTVTPVVTGQRPSALVTDGMMVYWINFGDMSIEKTVVGGGTATPVLTNIVQPGLLALVGSTIYFTNATQIESVATSGGAATLLYDNLPAPVTALAADADGLYWVHATLGTVERLRFSDGAQLHVATAQHTPQSIAVDATTMYWVELGTPGMNDGAIRKAAK